MAVRVVEKEFKTSFLPTNKLSSIAFSKYLAVSITPTTDVRDVIAAALLLSSTYYNADELSDPGLSYQSLNYVAKSVMNDVGATPLKPDIHRGAVNASELHAVESFTYNNGTVSVTIDAQPASFAEYIRKQVIDKYKLNETETNGDLSGSASNLLSIELNKTLLSALSLFIPVTQVLNASSTGDELARHVYSLVHVGNPNRDFVSACSNIEEFYAFLYLTNDIDVSTEIYLYTLTSMLLTKVFPLMSNIKPRFQIIIADGKIGYDHINRYAKIFSNASVLQDLQTFNQMLYPFLLLNVKAKGKDFVSSAYVGVIDSKPARDVLGFTASDVNVVDARDLPEEHLKERAPVLAKLSKRRRSLARNYFPELAAEESYVGHDISKNTGRRRVRPAKTIRNVSTYKIPTASVLAAIGAAIRAANSGGKSILVPSDDHEDIFSAEENNSQETDNTKE